MADHLATVRWDRGDQVFTDNKYSRVHTWTFDGGVTVPGSPSPSVVPAPLSQEDAVDPEEAFVAAIASCHMLWFLDLARRAGHTVDSYKDEAVGHMARKETGVFWIDKVALNPKISFSGNVPTAEQIHALHEEAHRLCFIANSVKSEIIVNG